MQATEKIANTIYGFAIGEAVGLPVDRKTRRYLNQYPVTEMLDKGTWDTRKGEYGDNTRLLLAMIDSLNDLSEENVADSIRNCHLLGNAPYSVIRAIRAWDNGVPPHKSAMNNSDKGALIRMVPFFFVHVDEWTIETIIKLTHNDVSLSEEYLNMGTNAVKGIAPIGIGSSYKEAVLDAVNNGGDTSIEGALIGALAGAYWGVPDDWKNEIKERDSLEYAIGRISEYC